MKIIKFDLTVPEQVIEIKEDSLLIAKYVGRQEDTIKSKITFLHTRPGINSRINIKSVLFDKARFDFEGILKINKGAIGTDTYLKIDCLVIGENAFARAIPSLEINESEVKGGHGATIGYLDPSQLYYLTSRGLTSKSSEEILIEAFLG